MVLLEVRVLPATKFPRRFSHFLGLEIHYRIFRQAVGLAVPGSMLSAP